MSNRYRYINEFFKLRCSGDLVGFFPNAKEVTESMAAFNAVRSYVIGDGGLRFDDPGVNLICVGDGTKPRTAALFALRTKWDCYSIDPALARSSANGIERLHIRPYPVETMRLDFTNPTVIVAVHSHAHLSLVLGTIRGNPRHLVVIPCCIPQEIPGKPYIGYQDTNIWSPKNTVKVWTKI